MALCEDKTAFLRYEVGILTLKAALSTRSRAAPIYAAGFKENQRSPVRDALRKELIAMEAKYSGARVQEEKHVSYISGLASRLSAEHTMLLHGGRLRFGIAQKLVNLHLKYLWTAGLVEEPPHCPIDGIVRDLAKLPYDWTTSDSEGEYRAAIAALAVVAAPRSLAVWELQEFRRREQGAA